MSIRVQTKSVAEFAAAANTTINLGTFDAQSGAISIVLSDFDAAGVIFRVVQSNDGANWEQIGSTDLISTALSDGEHFMFSFSDVLNAAFVGLEYTAGAETTGSVFIHLNEAL